MSRQHPQKSKSSKEEEAEFRIRTLPFQEQVVHLLKTTDPTTIIVVEGATGTGKSYILNEALKNRKQKGKFFYPQSESSLIGEWVLRAPEQAGGPSPFPIYREPPRKVFEKGVLPKVMRSGDALVISPLNALRGDMVKQIDEILHTRQLTLPDGEVVKAHPKFRVLGESDPNYNPIADELGKHTQIVKVS